MNKNWLRMKNDKRAEMGVGTMIIFIAMVLVAAVAASVLISTANTVREQAQATGEQAINNIASGFIVQDTVGAVSSGTDVQEVYIYMRLAAGSPAINMDNVMVQITTSDSSRMLKFEAVISTHLWGACTNTTYFGCENIKSASGLSWTTGSHLLGQGDMAKLYIGNTAGLLVGFSQTVEIKIIPAYGQMSLVVFTTGEAFPADYITLA
jgi:archaeal flagellin FlaB